MKRRTWETQTLRPSAQRQLRRRVREGTIPYRIKWGLFVRDKTQHTNTHTHTDTNRLQDPVAGGSGPHHSHAGSPLRVASTKHPAKDAPHLSTASALFTRHRIHRLPLLPASASPALRTRSAVHPTSPGGAGGPRPGYRICQGGPETDGTDSTGHHLPFPDQAGKASSLA